MHSWSGSELHRLAHELEGPDAYPDHRGCGCSAVAKILADVFPEGRKQAPEGQQEKGWQERSFSERDLLQCVATFVNRQDTPKTNTETAFLRAVIGTYETYSPERVFDIAGAGPTIGEHVMAAIALWQIHNAGTSASIDAMSSHFRRVIDQAFSNDDVLGDGWRASSVTPDDVTRIHHQRLYLEGEMRHRLRGALRAIAPFVPELIELPSLSGRGSGELAGRVETAKSLDSVASLLIDGHPIPENQRRVLWRLLMARPDVVELFELGPLRDGTATSFTPLQLIAEWGVAEGGFGMESAAMMTVFEDRFGPNWPLEQLDAEQLGETLFDFMEHHEANIARRAPTPGFSEFAIHKVETAYVALVHSVTPRWREVTDPFDAAAARSPTAFHLVTSVDDLVTKGVMKPGIPVSVARAVLRRGLQNSAGPKWRRAPLDARTGAKLLVNHGLRAEPKYRLTTALRKLAKDGPDPVAASLRGGSRLLRPQLPQAPTARQLPHARPGRQSPPQSPPRPGATGTVPKLSTGDAEADPLARARAREIAAATELLKTQSTSAAPPRQARHLGALSRPHRHAVPSQVSKPPLTPDVRPAPGHQTDVVGEAPSAETVEPKVPPSTPSRPDLRVPPPASPVEPAHHEAPQIPDASATPSPAAGHAPAGIEIPTIGR